MSQLKINLLPRDILLQRRQSSKVVLINQLSVALLVIVAALTAAILIIRVFQQSDLAYVTQNLSLAQSSVSSQSSKEAQEILLKQQLDAIIALSGKDSTLKAVFNLVVALTPKDIQISDAIVDKNNNMTLTLSSPSLSSINKLLSDLANPQKNSGLISKVSLDGLSVGKDGAYRFELKVASKKS